MHKEGAMRIWTTPRLKELLLGDGFTAAVQSERLAKAVCLEGAGPDDAALLPWDPDYRAFLSDLRRRGVRGPVLFILSDAAAAEDNLAPQNALTLDLGKVNAQEAGKIVRFIMTPPTERGYEAIEFEPSLVCNVPDPAEVKAALAQEVLSRTFSARAPVVVAFQVQEDIRNTVTAQGNCFIKSFSKDAVMLWRFSPSSLQRTLKKDSDIVLRFSLDSRTYEAVSKVLSLAEGEITVAVPSAFSPMTRRFSRIKPSPRAPVLAYVLMPKQPTTLLNVKEISQRGIGFTAPDGLAVGAVTAFVVLLPEPAAETILSAGIIKSKIECDNGFRYGTELLLHQKDEDKIARYVMHREQEIMGILRER